MNTDIETLVRTCIREVAPETDFESLAPDADLRETLRLDSLDFLRVVELLSERGGIRIDEEDYPRLATFASTMDFVAAARH